MRNAFPILLAIILSIKAPISVAGTEVNACISSAAAHHKIDERLLRAIAAVESNLNPNALGKNKNGTYDRGLMQINDWWLPTLLEFGITEENLLDPCVSAYVGAWILSQEIERHGPTWQAVGAYNSPTESHQISYVNKVHKKFISSQE